MLEDLKRLADRRVIAGVLIGLALLAGYQVWAYRQSGRNAKAVKVAKQADRKATRAVTTTKGLSKAACGNARLFYRLFNALVEDTTPAFGSPPDGPPIPGAREKLIGELYAAERRAAAPLRKQGCTIKVPTR